MQREPISRRSFLGTLFAASFPSWSSAQPAGRPFRIGVLANHVPQRDLELGAASPFHGTAAFVAGLRELGWRDGENIRIAWRSAEGRMDRHPELASELVRIPVDAIVGGDEAAVAAIRATRTTPIVAYSLYNPVERGFVKSLARPGGNVTGVASVAGAQMQKSLALLKEASPGIRRVAMVAQAYENADLHPGLRTDHPLRLAAAALGMDVFFLTFGDPRTLPDVVRSAVKQGADALVVDSTYAIHYDRGSRERLAEEAIRQRLPVMHLALTAAADGALMAHGTDLTACWRRASYFVDRILRGTHPGEIPIENARSVEFHLNLKAAKAIGLVVPPALLVQADRVFE